MNDIKSKLNKALQKETSKKFKNTSVLIVTLFVCGFGTLLLLSYINKEVVGKVVYISQVASVITYNPIIYQNVFFKIEGGVKRQLSLPQHIKLAIGDSILCYEKHNLIGQTTYRFIRKL